MSTIDKGPSNHEDDLGRALHDLVDDASLPGLDAHLDVVRGRTRRRRAAKKVALGATTLCVAGALGVAALSIPQDVRPEPIAPAESPSPTATPSPTPEPPPTFPAAITASALACQQPAPTPTGDDLPARLSIDIPDLAAQTPGSATAPVLMTFDDKVRLRYDDSATGAYVVVQDGVVVSSSLPAAETTGEATPTPGSSAGWEMEVTTVPTCGGASGHLSRLPAGSYEVFALHRFPLTGYSAQRPDGTWGDEATGTLFDGWLVSEPVPLTITPEPPLIPGAFASPTFTFPVAPDGPHIDSCSAPAPTPSAPDALGLLTIDEPRVSTQSGATVTVRLAQSAVPHAKVYADDIGGVILWQLTKDGQIVATGNSADAQPGEEPLGERTLRHTFDVVPLSCASSEGENLPPGEYQLYVTKPYRVLAYSLQLQDGTWGPVMTSRHTSPPWFYDWGLTTEPIPFTIT
ncbi:hypothetical protein [Oerskovia gallyi]|uniref:Uncharacterized protein n=1 Tax=Oerskovia gallyi TaxID=2762226 RepID=A0ABR8V6R3_9CELL|nr:hypothetical protein [Oerskovia gallyi]MBD8000468.1 hypothetical protein [Oerskovia gallyi]